MKLIIAIIRDHDNDPVSHALTTAGFRVTCIASTGGFLRRGMATLLAGVEDDQTESALQIIRNSLSPAVEPDAKRATIFVVKVDEYIHI